VPLLIVARKAEFASEKTRMASVVARRMRVEMGVGWESGVRVVEEESSQSEGGDQRRLTNLVRREGRSKLWTRSRVEVLRTDRCVVWRVAMCRPSGEGTEG